MRTIKLTISQIEDGIELDSISKCLNAVRMEDMEFVIGLLVVRVLQSFDYVEPINIIAHAIKHAEERPECFFQLAKAFLKCDEIGYAGPFDDLVSMKINQAIE